MSSKKEYINGDRCERKNVTVKCKIFVTVIQNFISLGNNKYDWKTRIT